MKKDRHAALVMINANHHEIKFEGRLLKFIQDKSELANKAIVTKVYRCSAYARLITDPDQSGQVYIGFKGSTHPSASISPVAVRSDEVDQPWQILSQSGNWSTGKYQHDPAPYTPLATLRQVTPKEPTVGYRGDIFSEIADTEEMEDYVLPWAALDEHGNEMDPDDLRAYLDG